jgi:hypothetical protein
MSAAPWVSVFCIAAMMVVAGVAVQFDGTPDNDVPGRMAIAIFSPVALLAGAVMWGAS